MVRAATRLIPMEQSDNGGREIPDDIKSNNTPIVFCHKKSGQRRRTELNNFRIRQGLSIVPAGVEITRNHDGSIERKEKIFHRKEIGPAYDFDITFHAGSPILKCIADGWLFLPVLLAEKTVAKVEKNTKIHMITPEYNERHRVFSVAWLTDDNLVEPHIEPPSS